MRFFVLKPTRLFCCLASALTLAGCAAPGQSWMGAPLKDTAWQLVTIESSSGDAGRQYVAGEVDISMQLLANGDAKFDLGCDKGGTDWYARPGRIDTKGEIEFYPLELAASSCEPDLTVNRLISDVPFLEGYVLIQNHLYLNTQANAKIYGWRQMPLK
jgi:hypothetical protein